MKADVKMASAKVPARNALQRLLKSRRGAVATTFVILAPVLVGAIAFGFDMSRYALARNELQRAADAAALAAAQNVFDNAANVAVTCGRLNLPSDLAGAARPRMLLWANIKQALASHPEQAPTRMP